MKDESVTPPQIINLLMAVDPLERCMRVELWKARGEGPEPMGSTRDQDEDVV